MVMIGTVASYLNLIRDAAMKEMSKADLTSSPIKHLIDDTST